MKIIKLFVLFVAISFVIGVGSAFNGQNVSSTDFVEKNDIESNSSEVESVESEDENKESTNVVDKDEQKEKVSDKNNSFSQSKSENNEPKQNKTSDMQDVAKEQQSVDKTEVEEKEVINQQENKPKEDNVQKEVVKETTPTVEEKKELTIWEELGITEHEYYNTPMFKWQTVTHNDFDSCDLAGKEATSFKKDEVTGIEYQDYSQYWCYGVNSYSGKFLGTMLKLTK